MTSSSTLVSIYDLPENLLNIKLTVHRPHMLKPQMLVTLKWTSTNPVGFRDICHWKILISMYLYKIGILQHFRSCVGFRHLILWFHCDFITKIRQKIYIYIFLGTDSFAGFWWVFAGQYVGWENVGQVGSMCSVNYAAMMPIMALLDKSQTLDTKQLYMQIWLGSGDLMTSVFVKGTDQLK